MKNLVVIFVIAVSLLILAPSLTMSQNASKKVWEKTFDKEGQTLFGLTVTKTNNYVTATNDQGNGYSQKINFFENNNIVWSENLNQSAGYMTFNNSVDMNNKDGFIVAFSDTLIVFDYQGNCLKKIKVPTTFSSPALQIYKNSDYYFVVEGLSDSEAQIFIYDNDLSFIRVFPIKGSVRKIAADDGYLYSGSTKSIGGNLWNRSSDISKYDMHGSLIWNVHLPDRLNARPILSNGWLYCASTNLLGDKPGQDWEVIKFDTAGNKIWSKEWIGDYPANSYYLGLWVNDILDLPTGGCIVIGQATKLNAQSDWRFPNATDPVAIAFNEEGDISCKIRETPGDVGRFLLSRWDNNHNLILAGDEREVVMDTTYNVIRKYSIDGITAVRQESSEIPTDYSLSQNYPNPFNPTTKINFSVPQSGQVSLKVYDLLGREVANLVNEELSAGNYNTKFDASQLASGVYVYRLTAKNFTSSKKMMLVK